LERREVKAFEEMSREELIQKIELAGSNFKMSPSSSGQDQAALMQAMLLQQRQVVETLRNQATSGRLVIRISDDIDKWENTAADIEVRPGDVLSIPKKPNFVLVRGQVYNSAALSYVPGRTAEWYLKQAGGATEMANKGEIFIVRANGSIVAKGSGGGGWWSSNVMGARMQPGDALIVPEKPLGGSIVWKNLLSTAQFLSGIAITARVATSF
jgi:protein involved in polysaccharide export with SLBB domain